MNQVDPAVIDHVLLTGVKPGVEDPGLDWPRKLVVAKPPARCDHITKVCERCLHQWQRLFSVEFPPETKVS